MGLAVALNVAINNYRADYYLRMDPDDICLPNRFEKQVAFMEQNQEIAASSAWIEEFDETLTISKGIRRTPVGIIDLNNQYSKTRSPLNHIPSIIRHAPMDSVGLYPNFAKAQDYALWSLLLVNGYLLSNIPLVLANVRSCDSKTDRRGISRLKHEIPVLFFQFKIGFLSKRELFYSLLLRGSMRIVPLRLRSFIFSHLRETF